MGVITKPGWILSLVVALVALSVAAWVFLTRSANASAWTARPGLLVRADGNERIDPSGLSGTLDAFVHKSQTATLPGIKVDYPLDGSLFPPGFAPPTLRWRDPNPEANAWLLLVTIDRGATRLWILASGDATPLGTPDARLPCRTDGDATPVTGNTSAIRTWRPLPEEWTVIQERSVKVPARITIFGFRLADARRAVSRGEVALATSLDPVGAPIFYRDVPLMPSSTENGVIKPLPSSMLPVVEWRLRDVGQTAGRLVLTEMYTCANCHSFSVDGKTMGMDVDGPTGDKGAYVLAPVTADTAIRQEDIITWNSFQGKLPDRNTIGFLSSVSPDGTCVVSTVNEEVYVANFKDFRFLQVFYPTRGILAWYRRDTREMRALPGADDPRYVCCDPVWYPSGEWIVFARARARDAYIQGRPLATFAGDPAETPIQYDLYRIPFNNGRGGTPEVIAGADDDGYSHSFPKVSPDGKWIVFVRSRNGQLMRPDSTLWIVPFTGGPARQMRCNTSRMNSWHSFSPNGRWLVFSSKVNTPYTQMFLTHLDADGIDTPPILIENATAPNRAVNIPEFVNVPYDRFQRISTPALAYYRDFHRGAELAEKGQIQEAIVAFRQALRTNPDDSRILNDLGVALGRLGAADESTVHLRRAIAVNPTKPQPYANLALVLMRAGKHDEALRCYDRSLALDAMIPEVWYSRGRLREKQGNVAGALADYTETIRLDPQYAVAYTDRGRLLVAKGKYAEALADCSKAIEIQPQSPTPWHCRGLVRLAQGDATGAAQDLRKCLAVAPPEWPLRSQVEQLLPQKSTIAP